MGGELFKFRDTHFEGPRKNYLNISVGQLNSGLIFNSKNKIPVYWHTVYKYIWTCSNKKSVFVPWS